MGGLFDYCVREPSPAPWRWLVKGGGRVSTYNALGVILVLFGFCYLFPFWGHLGFVLHILIEHVFLFADTMVSNAPGKNVVRLRRAGFSDWIILGIAEFNTVGSQLLGYVITVGLCGDPRFYTLSYAWRRLDVWLLCVVFVNLALAEAAFTHGHYLLHSRKSLLSLHVMHHCCVHASWTTNVLFHPIDLAIEFSGPAISLLLMHFIVWRDPFVLMVTFVIFQIWYALDHDESLKTYHYAHHTHNNSLYAIYINVKGKPRSNLLRDYMRKIVEKD